MEPAKTSHLETLECEVCLREIPASVAGHAEADEYVSHVCGLECYQKWRDRGPTLPD